MGRVIGPRSGYDRHSQCASQHGPQLDALVVTERRAFACRRSEQQGIGSIVDKVTG
jgi:hypothetical protein